MKKIRAIVSIILMVCLCFALSACGGSEGDTGNDNAVSAQTENTEEKNSSSETMDSTPEAEAEPVSDNTEAEQGSVVTSATREIINSNTVIRNG